MCAVIQYNCFAIALREKMLGPMVRCGMCDDVDVVQPFTSARVAMQCDHVLARGQLSVPFACVVVRAYLCFIASGHN
jgi:hypothetical protein